jgi:hypothetical protein
MVFLVCGVIFECVCVLCVLLTGGKPVYRYEKWERDEAVAALLQGLSLRQVSEMFHIPRKTLAKWKSQNSPSSSDLNVNSNVIRANVNAKLNVKPTGATIYHSLIFTNDDDFPIFKTVFFFLQTTKRRHHHPFRRKSTHRHHYSENVSFFLLLPFRTLPSSHHPRTATNVPNV